MALARGVGLALAPCIPAACFAGDGQHRNAVDRAWRHAQIAAGAKLGDHRVHLFRCANYCIDRTCLHAQRAADANLFVDNRQRTRPFDTVGGIQRNHRFAEQRGKACDAFGTAGRTLVVIGFAFRDGFGIRAACGIAALGALRLWQQIFDAICQRFDVCHGHDVGACLAAAQLELNGTLSPISPIAIRNPCAIIEALFRKTAENGVPQNLARPFNLSVQAQDGPRDADPDNAALETCHHESAENQKRS